MGGGFILPSLWSACSSPDSCQSAGMRVQRLQRRGGVGASPSVAVLKSTSALTGNGLPHFPEIYGGWVPDWRPELKRTKSVTSKGHNWLLNHSVSLDVHTTGQENMSSKVVESHKYSTISNHL